jgi:DNA-binding transcriptional LysR family regulator
VTGLGTLLVVVLVVPTFTGWAYSDYVLQTFNHHRTAFNITHDGRTFYYGRQDVADAANAMLHEVPKVAKPGDRLFVGTSDLRKTPVSDAYLYYLLPKYPPATYYIEMDPGVANAKGSRLASDLRTADLAILSGIWLDWNEPNDSRKLGSDAPNRVLARDFCLVGSYGTYQGRALYQLLTRRLAGRPCPPGTTAPRPPGT